MKSSLPFIGLQTREFPQTPALVSWPQKYKIPLSSALAAETGQSFLTLQHEVWKTHTYIGHCKCLTNAGEDSFRISSQCFKTHSGQQPPSEGLIVEGDEYNHYCQSRCSQMDWASTVMAAMPERTTHESTGRLIYTVHSVLFNVQSLSLSLSLACFISFHLLSLLCLSTNLCRPLHNIVNRHIYHWSEQLIFPLNCRQKEWERHRPSSRRCLSMLLTLHQPWSLPFLFSPHRHLHTQWTEIENGICVSFAEERKRKRRKMKSSLCL